MRYCSKSENILIFVVCIILSSMLFTGCGGTEPTSVPAETTEQAGTETTEQAGTETTKQEGTEDLASFSVSNLPFAG